MGGKSGLAGSLAVLVISALALFPLNAGSVIAFAENNDNAGDGSHKFEIWPEESQIAQNWRSFIHGKICPSPVSDSKNQTETDHDTGAVVDLGNSVQVQYFAVRPNGTQVKLDGFISDNYDFCREGINAYLQVPDSTGLWSVYGTARWVSNGSIREIKSNVVTVQVQPPLYQSNQVELLDNNTSIENLFDWSKDGKSVLVYFKTAGDQSYHLSLGILDVTTLIQSGVTKITPVDLPTPLGIWNARFSPADGSKILFGDTRSPQPFFYRYNMTILDIDSQKTRVIFDAYLAAVPRFSPSGDLVFFDDSSVNKTPGGPIELIGLDRGVHEMLKTGVELPGDDPSSFAISPDGKNMLVTVLQWSSGPMRLYKTEFAHSVPEFGNLDFAFLAMTASAAALIIAQKFAKKTV